MNSPSAITARVVPEDQRLKFLPRHFGPRCLNVESALYCIAAEQSPDYKGGYWEFYELDNGGIFMELRSDKPLKLVVPGNGFSEEVNARVFSVVVNLMLLNQLAWALQDEPQWADLYYALKDYVFADGNPFSEEERTQIYGAID